MWGEPDRLHMRYAILSIESVLSLGSQVVNVSVTVVLQVLPLSQHQAALILMCLALSQHCFLMCLAYGAPNATKIRLSITDCRSSIRLAMFDSIVDYRLSICDSIVDYRLSIFDPIVDF